MQQDSEAKRSRSDGDEADVHATTDEQKKPAKQHRTQDDGDTNTTANADKRNVEWATTIKSHHENLRRGIEDVGGNVDRMWAEMTSCKSDGEALSSSPAALQSYAEAMYLLATRHWTSGPKHTLTTTTDSGLQCDAQRQQDVVSSSGGEAQRTPRPPVRHDDRVIQVLKLLASYFVGKKRQQGEEERLAALSQWVYDEIPQLASIPLKQKKREYFALHQQGMPPQESQRIAREIMCHWEEASNSKKKKALRVLDVGSCFNPFSGLCIDEWQRGEDEFRIHDEHSSATAAGTGTSCCCPLDVTALDLCPALPFTKSGVFRSDWLKMKFTTTASSESTESRPTQQKEDQEQFAVELPSLPACSFDAVVFCLLLSYMPTTEMRLRSVIKAYNALAQHGLLVIVSTKTQGTRKSGWIQQWCDVISAIGHGKGKEESPRGGGGGGFVKVHQVILHQLVVLSFRKAAAVEKGAVILDEEAELRWFREVSPQLQLQIAADEDGGEAVI